VSHLRYNGSPLDLAPVACRIVPQRAKEPPSCRVTDSLPVRDVQHAHWVGLDQYKERKPKDPTIREKFNTYRFADHKEKVIDLLMRVTTVSVETQKITEQMREPKRDE